MKRLILLVFWVIYLCPSQAAEYTFGIVPQQDTARLAQAWTPILQQLSDQTGDTFRFTTAPSIPEFEQRCADGVYDFAYMNPYHYTVFSRHPGYRVFANQADKKILGIIVVRQDSDINNLQQLQQQPLAFPAPAAFAASMLTRAYLRDHQVRFQPNYVYSHDAVYRAVADGSFIAGGGIMRTLNAVDPALRDQLKVLWTTDKYTPHAFAAHPRVPATVVEAVSRSLTTLHDNSATRPLLDAIGFSAIQRARDNDWDDVRALKLELLDTLIPN